MKKLNSAYEYGYEYAREMQSEPGFDNPVDIDEMVGGTVDMPDGDYTAMREAGVEPDARQYWAGFNAFFKKTEA